MTEPTNNVESLLTAILKNDSSYLVVPQSRVEELLLAIYKNGGGGGGGSDITRYEVEQMLLGKVDTKPNYSLISDSEIERLSGVDNYDDKSIRDELRKKVEKQNGYSLILNTDYDNFKKLENYDDSELRTLINNIAKDLESLVPNDRTIAGKKLDKNISVDDLLKALNLDKVNNTSDLDKPISNATQAALDTKSNKTFIDSVDSETSVVTVPEGTSFAAVGKICGKTVKDGEVLKSAPVKSVVSMSKNLCPPFNHGYTINTINGTDYPSSKCATSDYIPITNKHVYITGVKSAASHFVAWYDKDKNYISRTGAVNRDWSVVDLPDNAAYIRITNYSSITPEEATNLKVMVSYDNSPYTPYNKTTVSIPEEILNLPDYGCGIDNYYNWVDFENMVYHHKVKKVSGKDLNFTMSTSSGNVYHTLDIVTQRLICSNYEFANINVTDNATAETLLANMQCTYRHGTIDRFYFKNTSVTTLEAFKESIKNSVIVYAINEELIDISSILYPFPVESGGIIKFVNEHNLDVPNTVLYKKEVL